MPRAEASAHLVVGRTSGCRPGALALRPMSTESPQRTTPAADWGRTVVLVRDPDQSLRFYREAFGAHVIHDSTVNGFRYLHVSIGTGGLWLIAADERSADSVGRQTAGHPLGVVYVSD